MTDIKLDFGCGQNPREGFEGVDLYAPNAKHKVNLFKFPYPFADNSVDEIHSSHFVEHLPARSVEERDCLSDPEKFVDKDFLFAFFDECFRILKPEGKMLVIVPAGTSTRAFQDPTHRRFIVYDTFWYLSKEWRKANALDHYNVNCDFGFSISHTCDQAMNLRHPEYQAHMFRHFWNVMYDIHCTLVPKK